MFDGALAYPSASATSAPMEIKPIKTMRHEKPPSELDKLLQHAEASPRSTSSSVSGSNQHLPSSLLLFTKQKRQNACDSEVLNFINANAKGPHTRNRIAEHCPTTELYNWNLNNDPSGDFLLLDKDKQHALAAQVSNSAPPLFCHSCKTIFEVATSSLVELLTNVCVSMQSAKSALACKVPREKDFPRAR